MKRFLSEAILFDLDGVLIDTTKCLEKHWTIWAQKKGLDAKELISMALGERTIDTIKRLAPMIGIKKEADIERVALELEEKENKFLKGISRIKGAKNLLHSLPPDAWAVVTSGMRNTAISRLKYTSLPTPKVLISAEDVNQGKPHPGGYILAASRLGIPNKKCLVIEDSNIGIQAGNSAGMIVIGVASTSNNIKGAKAYIPNLKYISVNCKNFKNSKNVLEILVKENTGIAD